MPNAKMADTPIRLLLLICNLHTVTIGMARIAKSETMLIVPPATKTASLLMQCPGFVGIHSFSLGTHGHISMGRFAK